MRETIAVTGIVLSTMPIGEYDKRVVLLTKEKGKIHAFARGAKRAKSPLMAGTNPFAFGTFHIFENRSSNSLERAEITNYFRELAEDFEAAYYGMYFCELADYYTVEYLEAVSVLKLLYRTLQELTKDRIPRELIRYIFELKLLQLNGEAPNVSACSSCGNSIDKTAHFSVPCQGLLCDKCAEKQGGNFKLDASTIYTLQYIFATPIEKLYSFLVKDGVLRDLRAISGKYFIPNLDRNMKSLGILEDCLKLSGFYT